MNSTPINLNKTWDIESGLWAPLKITRDTCEIDRYEQMCGPYEHEDKIPSKDEIPHHNMDMLFEMLFRPLDDIIFVPTPHLEQLDEHLREAYEKPYYPEPPTEEKASDFDDNRCTNLIETYKNALNISASEAFELLRRCHGCGSANMEFGKEYCNEKCETNHMNLDYPCHWNRARWFDRSVENCKICKLTEDAFALRR
jgi:hypothetical protein